MTDALRKKLATRAKYWNTKRTPPSQLRSERLKKKLRRGQAPVESTQKPDCCGCEKDPCGKTLTMCGENSMIGRCRQCGRKAFYRVVVDEDYYCQSCREKR